MRQTFCYFNREVVVSSGNYGDSTKVAVLYQTYEMYLVIWLQLACCVTIISKNVGQEALYYVREEHVQRVAVSKHCRRINNTTHAADSIFSLLQGLSKRWSRYLLAPPGQYQF